MVDRPSSNEIFCSMWEIVTKSAVFLQYRFSPHCVLFLQVARLGSFGEWGFVGRIRGSSQQGTLESGLCINITSEYITIV